MVSRYIETKRELTVVWAGAGILFGTGFTLLMGDSLSDSLLFGLALAIGFAIGTTVFFKQND